MMAALTVAGVVIGLIALVLAVVALRRPIPAVQFQPLSSVVDGYELWNAGPGDAVIIDAVVSSAGAEYWPAGDAPTVAVSLDEALGAWRDPSCAGTVLRQSRHHVVQIGTNCDLTIRYRASGFMGRLSRAKVRIDGDV